MKKNLKWIIFGMCMFIFLLLVVSILKDNSLSIDIMMYDWISKYIIGENMTFFMKFITWFGSTIGIIIVGLISLLIRPSQNFTFVV